MIIALLQDWFYYPHTSGFLVFLMGGWSLFAVYHLLLYITNRNLLYPLYGLYLLAIMGYQAFFLRELYPFLDRNPLKMFISNPEFFAELSYLIYFAFAFKFLDIKTEFPRWYSHIKKALWIIAIFCLFSFILNVIDEDKLRSSQLYHFFVIYILVLSVLSYIMFFRSTNKLRFYIIVGSLFLTIFSVLSLIITVIHFSQGDYYEWPFTLLYIGYMLETILFALGLGHYQYFINKERLINQTKLIDQFKENEALRLKVQEQLESDVQKLSKKAEEDKIENLKIRFEKELAELKVLALRSQMNPHFIFNSLNSIKRYIIDNEQENAVYYLNKFSKLIRKILSSSMESTISLAEELEIASLYVNIENIRFNNDIDFTLNVDDSINLETLKVPSMVMQPFLENAIWHGLSPKKKDMVLRIDVGLKNNQFLHVKISDNGIGRVKSREIKSKKVHRRKSIGIKLTEDRLKTFANNLNNSYSINFKDLYDSENNAVGTEVLLEIPIN